MKFIDANIFLELILDDKKADQCQIFFDNIRKGKEIYCMSDYILYTCLFQIEYKLKSLESMKEFIQFVNSVSNIKIVRPSLLEIYNAIDIAKEYNLDLDDALIISIMVENKMKELVSFDKDFDKVKFIKIEEP